MPISQPAVTHEPGTRLPARDRNANRCEDPRKQIYLVEGGSKQKKTGSTAQRFSLPPPFYNIRLLWLSSSPEAGNKAHGVLYGYSGSGDSVHIRCGEEWGVVDYKVAWRSYPILLLT